MSGEIVWRCYVRDEPACRRGVVMSEEAPRLIADAVPMRHPGTQEERRLLWYAIGEEIQALMGAEFPTAKVPQDPMAYVDIVTSYQRGGALYAMSEDILSIEEAVSAMLSVVAEACPDA